MSGRVTYFVQTHRDPPQIYRLVRTLRRGSASGRILVLHDFAASPLDWAPLAGLPDTHLLRASAPCVRATFSFQVQPWLDAIDWLEQERLAYEWLVNLSGQDYPVRPVAAIEALLGEAACHGFIRHWNVLSPANPWSRRKARHRYWYRYRKLGPGAERPLRALRFLTRVLPVHFYLTYGPLVGVRALSVPFGDGFPCHGGLAWFSLRREAVLYVRRFLAERPEILRHYRRSVAPEESLVHTVLANSGRFELTDDDRRYVDYTGSKTGSPRVLGAADLPALASERYDFARKFDFAVDRVVLDRIDDELLATD